MVSRMKNKAIALLQLTKPIITLSVSFSALTGFLLFSGAFVAPWVPTYLGVMLVAAGSSTINQIQESDIDRFMKRTLNRPLPSGSTSMLQAWLWTAFLVVSGSLVLLLFSGVLPFTLVLITLMWYNGLYTPLKRFTPLAVFPGAVVGAIPPVIGYTAAGGSLFDSQILLLSLFFFAGQIPHFWIILLRHGNDYQKAGLPSLLSKFTERRILNLTFVWVTITALGAVLLPFSGVTHSIPAMVSIIGLSLLLLIVFFRLRRIYDKPNVDHAFIIMNVYFLLIMIVIIVDAVFLRK